MYRYSNKKMCLEKEIKFIAWYCRKMYKVVAIHWDKGRIGLGFTTEMEENYAKFSEVGKDCILMRFTGLTDKN